MFLDKDEYVRIVGEDLQIHCTTHNPNFNYIVTWKHPSTMVSKQPECESLLLPEHTDHCSELVCLSGCLQRTTVKEDARSNGENRLDIESILTAKSLSPNDAGNITCIGTNEAGVNSSTTYLRVIGRK